MDDEELTRKVAMAIYAASGLWSLVTVYDAMRFAEAAVRTIRDEEAKARLLATVTAEE